MNLSIFKLSFIVLVITILNCAFAKVHLENGSFSEVYTDWNDSTQSRLHFSRIYNSKANNELKIGKNFFHNFSDFLTFKKSAIIWSSYPGSKEKVFLKVKPDSWLKMNEQIIKRNKEYRLILNNQEIRYFDIKGKLVRIDYSPTLKLELIRNSLNQIIQINKNKKDFIKLGYSSRGEVSFVEIDSDSKINYAYDIFGRLQKVIRNGKLIYEYMYFNNRLNLLTKVLYEDETYKTFSYSGAESKYFLNEIKSNDEVIKLNYNLTNRDIIKLNVTYSGLRNYSEEHKYIYKNNKLGRYIRAHEIKDTFGVRKNIYNYEGRVIKTESNGISSKVLYSKDGKSTTIVTGDSITQKIVDNFGTKKIILNYKIKLDKKELDSKFTIHLSNALSKIKKLEVNRSVYDFVYLQQGKDSFLQISKNKVKYITLQYVQNLKSIKKAQIHNKGILEFVRENNSFPSMKTQKIEGFNGNLYAEYKKALNELRYDSWE